MDRQECRDENLGVVSDVTVTDKHIDIYRIFVQTITAAESRRQQVSAMYMSVIAVIGTAAATFKNSTPMLLAAIIIIFSTAWLVSICYFRRLAKAKFHVIKKIESDLVIASFKIERDHYERSGKRIELTQIEMAFPIIAIVGGMTYCLWSLFC